VTAADAADAPDLEPAVRTSSAATEPSTPMAPAAAPALAPGALPAAAPGTTPATPSAHRPSSPAAAAATGAATPKAGARAHDSIDLDATQITGNRELPNVMYVVPWKRPDLGDFAGRPPKSLIDEALAPVDRDVFRRQNRYFAALHPDAANAPAAAPAAPPAAVPAAGAPATLPARDEK
jgi:hypothetical protein